MSRTKLFSRQAWDKNASIYEVIRTMPFNAELAAGTLSEARFKHYITQDAHYLIGFGRALTLAAAKAPNPDRIVQFAKAAEGALVVEHAVRGEVQDAVAGEPAAQRELAAFYGVDAQPGADFAKVDLDPSQRAGLLTTGTLLAINSADDFVNPPELGLVERLGANVSATDVHDPSLRRH